MVISTLRRIVFFGSVCIFLGSAGGGCGNQEKRQKPVLTEEVPKITVERVVADTTGQKEDSGIERRMRQLGLVDIGEVDPTIAVHLVYATSDNFAGKVLYRDIRKAFLLPEAAERLAEAQRKLKLLRPELSLLVYDAARPMKVQQEMWDLVKGTENRVYVSNPRNGGGLHNYGAAVDLTLVDSLGHVLPMGSEFDYFGEEARPDREEAMVKQGRIILPHLHNRRLLRKVMTDAGFRVLPSEWWHFNLMSRAEARVRLKVIE